MSDTTETELGVPVDSEGAGDAMHVHKPKAAHSVREFLSEISVIVVGIAIALAGEQAVEGLHWREVVSLERESLDGEAVRHWIAMEARVDMQSCVDSRLSELAILFSRHEAGEPLGRLGPMGRPMYMGESRAAWQMAIADQSLAHMTPALRARYERTNGAYDIFTTTANEERAAWRTLQQFDHSATLSSSDWSELRKAYDEALDDNAVLKRALVTNASSEWLTAFAGLNLPKQPHSLRGIGAVQDLYKPMLKPS